MVAAMAVTGVIVGAVGSSASAGSKSNPLKGEGEGLKLVKNVAYKGGTDMEFATIKGRDYAFAGSSPNYSGGEKSGLRVIDVTKPEKAKVVGMLPCALNQADVQISHDKKTVIYAADSRGGPEGCLAANRLGFMTVDIRNPKKPKAIGFAEIPRGSHNTTAHPTKPFVYNSDSELTVPGEIQVWSIKNPRKPKLVNTLALPGHSPHDISFNKKGNLAITAAISSIHLLDTSDPANPSIKFVTQCPGCSITHDAKFTPNGKHVLVGDEAGGGSAVPCPGGALYFYDLVEDSALVLKGAYEPSSLVTARSGQTSVGACTSHVMDISKDSKKVSISWYTAGTRLIDISDPTGFAFGSQGAGNVREIAWFIPDGAVSWSSKMWKGPYVYSNDMQRGFDVYKITAK